MSDSGDEAPSGGQTKGDTEKSLGVDSDCKHLGKDQEVIATETYLVARLGDTRYAFAAKRIEQVMEAIEPVRVPAVSSCYLGILSIGGRIVTVVDFAALMGLTDTQEDTDEDAQGEASLRRLIVLEGLGKPLGVVADELLGLQDIPLSAIRVTGDDSSTHLGQVLVGEFEFNDRIVTVVNAEAVVAGLMKQSEAPANV